jgi:ABC-type antimicrobial peptide transport system ATPase subunit
MMREKTVFRIWIAVCFIAGLFATATAQQKQQFDPASAIDFTPQRIETLAIAIHDGSGKVTVSVRWTGEVVLGEGVTLDEASMKFWEQLGQHLSQACPKVK